MKHHSPDSEYIHVPRAAFVLTVLAIGALFSTISEKLTIGPSWTVLLIIAILLVPTVAAIMRGHHVHTRVLAFIITGVMTLGLISSVSFLIYALFHHTASAASLFKSAGLLWVVNIGVFAVWYWEIDSGGPLKRHSGTSERPDFLFPQMGAAIQGWEAWTPSFFDYLFLAFNTNTAFSPTDTTVLSKRAKVLMMIQAAISILIVTVLAARAINIA